MVDITGPMEINLLVIGTIMQSMEKESMCGQTEESIAVNGNKT
jgi:hypothetical protein